MIRNFLYSAFLLLTTSLALADEPDAPHLINQAHLVNLPYEADAKQYDRAIMELIFREPCVEIRRAVLAGYVAQFRYFNPTLLADARALDGRLETDQITADLLEVMAEISPSAAFRVLRALLKTIQPVERFTDSWNQEFEAINLENISGAPTWLGSHAAAVGFLNGLDRSKEDPETKANLKILFVAAWDRYFSETKEFDTTPESEKQKPHDAYHTLAESRAEILPLFTQIASQMKPAMKRGAMLNYKEMVLCAMIRWLYMEPESGELILAFLPGLEWPEQPQDAESELDEINAWITTEFFRHWGRQNADASLAALDKLKDGQREFWAKCGLIAFVPKTMQNAWVKDLKKIEAEESTLRVKPHKLFAGWAVAAPQDALAAAEQIGKKAMGACLLVDDSCGPAFKEYVAAIQPYLLKVSEDDLAWYILEAWGEIDSELTVSAGINWLLTNAPKRKSRLLKEWTNKTFIPDGSLEDRVFGNLRYWAFTQPKAMEKWIAKQPDAKIRKALTWLLKHAKGVPYQPTPVVP